MLPIHPRDLEGYVLAGVAFLVVAWSVRLPSYRLGYWRCGPVLVAIVAEPGARSEFRDGEAPPTLPANCFGESLFAITHVAISWWVTGGVGERRRLEPCFPSRLAHTH
ncbi:MAG: hypothetical protein JSU68_10740 [Phycisphaerales bacterium]|nr:MAG: hypothetical protein JSU68_10740 [Phycisphaerales bacterium]